MLKWAIMSVPTWKTATSISVVALVLANVAPLIGVFLLGWNAAAILLLYWAENLVIGFFSILKIVLAKANPPVSHLQKLIAVPFFCLHFGGFCGLHGAFLLFFLRIGDADTAMFPKHLLNQIVTTRSFHL